MKEDGIINKTNPLPNTGSFLMTEDCNLACKYCFEHHKKNRMTPEVIERALIYFYENAKVQNKNEVNITVFGGEPLLEPDLIRILFQRGLELQEEYLIEFKAGIITNGTVLNKKVKQLLLDYKDKINMGFQISVDGNEEAQDLCRVTKQGHGSFHLVAKNIEAFKEIFKDNVGMLHLHGVVSKKTLPLMFESYKFFREQWDISRIWFMPVHEDEWVDSDVILYKDQLNKIADYIISNVKDSNSIKDIKNYSPLNKCFEKRTTVNPPCSAGKTYVTITANGDIYPCHHFYFNDPQETMKIGDVWSGIEDEKRKPFLEITNNDMTCENNCSIFNCYRCLGSNWVKNGDMHEQIKGYYCEMAHIENEVILRIRAELEELNLMEKPKEYSIEESIDLIAQGMKVLIMEFQDIKAKQDIILEKLGVDVK